MSPSHIKFTQNFLHDAALVQRLVKQANLSPGDTVLEVGPGKGIITTALATAVGATGRVVAVELDTKLASKLTRRFQRTPAVSITQNDILQFPLASLGEPYAVFSNIPFNITSQLLEHLLNPINGPREAHLILQTDTLLGRNKFGATSDTLKSLLIRPIYDWRITHHFARSDFSPQPSVDTALFQFTKRSDSAEISPADYEQYKDFLAFAAKDRVGEGKWLRLFSKKQIGWLAQNGELVAGRGLKSQSFSAIWQAFRYFRQNNSAKSAVIAGAFASLRTEQRAKDKKNRAHGHHRTKRRRS